MSHEHIEIHDFCFMRQGKILHHQTPEEAGLLDPVNITTTRHERALLLIHGFSSSPAVYRTMLNKLSGYDALICPKLPGHGQSLSSFGQIRASDWLTFIEQTYDELAKRYTTVDVLGLSLGGLLACHLAQTRDVHRVYLLAPALALNLMPFAGSFVKLINHIGIQHIPNRGGNILNSQHGELTFYKLPTATIHEIISLVHTFKLRPFKSKVDVFLGKEDRVIDLNTVAEKMGQLPQANIHWLENSAHVLPLDNNVQYIIDVVNNDLLI